MSEPDLSRPRRVHIVGIGGAGMSAIATVLVAMGHEVSGSDLKDGVALERLRALGVRVAIGHDRANIGAAEFLAISSRGGGDERRGGGGHGAAERSCTGGQSCSRRSPGYKRTISVSGTHGKTTTSSMLALILVEAGLSPSFIIGGEINEIGSGAVWDEGEWLVVEADESDGTFLELASGDRRRDERRAGPPRPLRVLREPRRGLRALPRRRRRRAVVCGDDPTAARLAPPGATTYGFAAGSTWRITEFAGGRSDVSFVLTGRGTTTRALAAGAGAAQRPERRRARRRRPWPSGPTSRQCGGRWRASAASPAASSSAARRKARRSSTTTPTCPARSRRRSPRRGRGGWRRVVCVFQPHRYSRIAASAGEFADAFVDADELIVTDIYGAGEAPRPGVSGKLVVDAVLAAHPGRRRHVPSPAG